MSLKINIRTVPHSSQRYNTVGDYYEDDGDNIYISDLGDDDMEFLVAVHELVEMWLARKHGIKEEDITKFDKHHLDVLDPGDHPKAPYQREHNFATSVERMLSAVLDIKWQEYDDRIDKVMSHG